MAEEKQQISVQQYVTTLRSQIVLSYDSAKETALKCFDDMTGKYIEQLQKSKEEEGKGKDKAKETPVLAKKT